MIDSSASALILGDVVECCWDSGKSVAGDAGCLGLDSYTSFGLVSGGFNILARLSMESTIVSSFTAISGPERVQDVVCGQVTGIQ